MKCLGGHRSGNAKTYNGFGGGKRDDLNGLYVRSGWEANWARYLNWQQQYGFIHHWEYEPDTFEFPVKRGSKFYTPDFKVWTSAEAFYYDEVKGYMSPESKTKLKRMARYYPHIQVRLVARERYTAVARQMRGVVPNWETARKHSV